MKKRRTTKALFEFIWDEEEKKVTFEAIFDPPIAMKTMKDIKKEWKNIPDSHKFALLCLPAVTDALEKAEKDYGDECCSINPDEMVEHLDTERL